MNSQRRRALESIALFVSTAALAVSIPHIINKLKSPEPLPEVTTEFIGEAETSVGHTRLFETRLPDNPGYVIEEARITREDTTFIIQGRYEHYENIADVSYAIVLPDSGESSVLVRNSGYMGALALRQSGLNRDIVRCQKELDNRFTPMYRTAVRETIDKLIRGGN